MTIPFKLETTLGIEVSPGVQEVNLRWIEYRLILPPQVDKKAYINDNGPYTKAGIKTISNVLVQTLLTNLRSAHRNGEWDSAEHLRWIIAELERGFIKLDDGEISYDHKKS